MVYVIIWRMTVGILQGQRIMDGLRNYVTHGGWNFAGTTHYGAVEKVPPLHKSNHYMPLTMKTVEADLHIRPKVESSHKPICSAPPNHGYRKRNG